MGINQQLAKFQDYLKNMPQDEVYSYIAMFVGVFLILIAFMIW